MTFISYAQNFEDVMLHRALKDIDKGFYIDVGANDPVVDSVTKAFYATGWRGINIEPVGEWFNKLSRARSKDINLQLAVGACEDKLLFHEVIGTGLSTLDESIAKAHAKNHGYELRRYTVLILPLTTICEKYVDSEIHFLKINVEGTEKSVLQGLDLNNFRPWIILVEATLPNTQIEIHEQWEYLLTSHGYHYVYFDGLNRFCVADEYEEFDSAFEVPPNYFDYFKRASEEWLELHSQELQKELDKAVSRIEQLKISSALLESTLQGSENRCLQFETKLQSVHLEVGRLDDKLREREKLINILNIKLEEAKHQFNELHKENLHGQTKVDQYKNELDEARSKIGDLSQSSCHWWLEVDRLSTELESVYNSKSWRITLPLRRLTQFF